MREKRAQVRDDSGMSHLMRAQRGKFHWRVISALAVDLRTPRKRRKCCPECGKVQFRHILIELFRDNVRAEENGVPQATYHTRLCSPSCRTRGVEIAETGERMLFVGAGKERENCNFTTFSLCSFGNACRPEPPKAKTQALS